MHIKAFSGTSQFLPSINYLHLDSLYTFRDIVKSYGTCALKAQLWCRLSILAQSIILILTTTLKQLTRGISFIISGLITFDARRFFFGLKDIVSVLVQSVMPLVLGMIATFHPAKGA